MRRPSPKEIANLCIFFVSLDVHYRGGRNASKTATNTSAMCRTCRCGFGTEKNEGKGDTPGMPMREKAEIKDTDSGFKKLFMPRNDPKFVQSSVDLLQSWRGNCDIQILIYESDPEWPDPSEIARVTDYVVGYACKGAQTTKQEKDQIKAFILKYVQRGYLVDSPIGNVSLLCWFLVSFFRASEETGDESDVKRLAKRLLNRAASNRLISKQECLVLLLAPRGRQDKSTAHYGLRLVKCSDRFDIISLTGSTRVNGNSNSFIKRYTLRERQYLTLSLHDYYHIGKKQSTPGKKSMWSIPHYVGGRAQPIYPVTKEYVRATMMIHRPWRGTSFNFDETSFDSQLEKFIRSESCPDAVKIPYHRVLKRYYDSQSYHESVAKKTELNRHMSDDNEMFLQLCGRHGFDDDANERTDWEGFDFGLNFDWSKCCDQVRFQRHVY